MLQRNIISPNVRQHAWPESPWKHKVPLKKIRHCVLCNNYPFVIKGSMSLQSVSAAAFITYFWLIVRKIYNKYIYLESSTEEKYDVHLRRNLLTCLPNAKKKNIDNQAQFWAIKQAPMPWWCRMNKSRSEWLAPNREMVVHTTRDFNSCMVWLLELWSQL